MPSSCRASGPRAPAMDRLERYGLLDPLRAWIAADRPYLGICLGLQLLFEASDEDGAATLGAAARADRPTDRRPDAAAHRLEPGRPRRATIRCSRASPMAATSTSSIRTPANPSTRPRCSRARRTDGRSCRPCAPADLLGVQFHPERSGGDGLRLLAQLRRPGPHVERVGGRGRPPDAAPSRHPVPGRRGRPGRQGHPVRRPRRRRRSARARRALRPRGSRRARLPRHHGRTGAPRDAPRHRRADRSPRVHPAHGGRRRPLGDRHARRPAGRCRQGLAEHRGGRRPVAHRVAAPGASVARPSSSRSMPASVRSTPRRPRRGRSSSRADARPPASTRSRGRSGRSRWAPASCW